MRDSLGRFSGDSFMFCLRWLVAITAAAAAPLSSQDSLARAKFSPHLDTPDWVYADTNLVQPSWIAASIPKNVVVVIFKPGTGAVERQEALAAVHGELIVTDSMFWLVRVAVHPNACGVRQAMDRLAQFPSVASAGPDVVWVRTESGGLSDAPGPKGPSELCPPGASLLR